jgi:hypothetical protein
VVLFIVLMVIFFTAIVLTSGPPAPKTRLYTLVDALKRAWGDPPPLDGVSGRWAGSEVLWDAWGLRQARMHAEAQTKLSARWVFDIANEEKLGIRKNKYSEGSSIPESSSWAHASATLASQLLGLSYVPPSLPSHASLAEPEDAVPARVWLQGAAHASMMLGAGANAEAEAEDEDEGGGGGTGAHRSGDEAAALVTSAALLAAGQADVKFAGDTWASEAAVGLFPDESQDNKQIIPGFDWRVLPAPAVCMNAQTLSWLDVRAPGSEARSLVDRVVDSRGYACDAETVGADGCCPRSPSHVTTESVPAASHPNKPTPPSSFTSPDAEDPSRPLSSSASGACWWWGCCATRTDCVQHCLRATRRADELLMKEHIVVRLNKSYIGDAGTDAHDAHADGTSSLLVISPDTPHFFASRADTPRCAWIDSLESIIHARTGQAQPWATQRPRGAASVAHLVAVTAEHEYWQLDRGATWAWSRAAGDTRAVAGSRTHAAVGVAGLAAADEDPVGDAGGFLYLPSPREVDGRVTAARAAARYSDSCGELGGSWHDLTTGVRMQELVRAPPDAGAAPLRVLIPWDGAPRPTRAHAHAPAQAPGDTHPPPPSPASPDAQALTRALRQRLSEAPDQRTQTQAQPAPHGDAGAVPPRAPASYAQLQRCSRQCSHGRGAATASSKPSFGHAHCLVPAPTLAIAAAVTDAAVWQILAEAGGEQGSAPAETDAEVVGHKHKSSGDAPSGVAPATPSEETPAARAGTSRGLLRDAAPGAEAGDLAAERLSPTPVLSGEQQEEAEQEEAASPRPGTSHDHGYGFLRAARAGPGLSCNDACSLLPSPLGVEPLEPGVGTGAEIGSSSSSSSSVLARCGARGPDARMCQAKTFVDALKRLVGVDTRTSPAEGASPSSPLAKLGRITQGSDEQVARDARALLVAEPEYTCDVDVQTLVNRCEILQRFFRCSRCSPSEGYHHPSFVSPNKDGYWASDPPPPGNWPVQVHGECHTNEKMQWDCDARKHNVARLCLCVRKSAFYSSYIP